MQGFQSLFGHFSTLRIEELKVISPRKFCLRNTNAIMCSPWDIRVFLFQKDSINSQRYDVLMIDCFKVGLISKLNYSNLSGHISRLCDKSWIKWKYIVRDIFTKKPKIESRDKIQWLVTNNKCKIKIIISAMSIKNTWHTR